MSVTNEDSARVGRETGVATRTIAIVGAPSAIGIRPYSTGERRHLDLAPQALRELDLAPRLAAIDLGDVRPPAYRDFLRPARRARNEPEVVAYSRALGDRVALATENHRFALVLGGDCSVVLGSLLGARRQVGGGIGLAYADAHADFATPDESHTGSAASMALALAVGRGRSPLAQLGGVAPLVDGADVALVGRRDVAESWYGHAALAASAILDLPDAEVSRRGLAQTSASILERVTRPGLRGFWIHLDVDVIDPSFMAAVDSPLPGGPTPEDLVELLSPLVRHPAALGLDVSIYDPGLDPGGGSAAVLVSVLERLLGREAQASS
jgi:arginase